MCYYSSYILIDISFMQTGLCKFVICIENSHYRRYVILTLTAYPGTLPALPFELMGPKVISTSVADGVFIQTMDGADEGNEWR